LKDLGLWFLPDPKQHEDGLCENPARLDSWMMQNKHRGELLAHELPGAKDALGGGGESNLGSVGGEGGSPEGIGLWRIKKGNGTTQANVINKVCMFE